MATDRPLTDSEQNILNLLKTYERACDERKQVITLTGDLATTEAISKADQAGFIKVFQVAFNGSTGRYDIIFRLQDFQSYLNYAMTQLGMRLYLDGSVVTADKIVISNDYLGKM